MRHLIFTLILVMAVSACPAQGLRDSTPVTVRKIPADKLNAYRADPAFQYEPATEPVPTYWDRFWDWFWGKIGNLVSTPRGARTIRLLLILFASGLLLFFIIRLSGMSSSGIFGKKNWSDPLEGHSTDEDIHAINFGLSIQQAIANSNFRLAIRLLYLQSLKALADRDMIHWQMDKTNSAYVHELKDGQQQAQFYQLTRRFENNWYGNMPVNENEFGLIKNQFEQFNQQLQ